MECELCEKHFCTDCLGMTEEEYKHHAKSSGMWFCIVCKPKVEQTLKVEKEIDQRCKVYFEQYGKRLNTIEAKIILTKMR